MRLFRASNYLHLWNVHILQMSGKKYVCSISSTAWSCSSIRSSFSGVKFMHRSFVLKSKVLNLQ